MIIYNLTLDIIADMFGEFFSNIGNKLSNIFGKKPDPALATNENAVAKPAATDEKAVAKPAAIAPPSVATDENAVATDKKAVTNPAAATNVKAQVPPSPEAAIAAGGQKGGSRRRRRRSCGKSKKGGAYSGMGFGRVGGKSRRRSKKRNTHKRRK